MVDYVRDGQQRGLAQYFLLVNKPSLQWQYKEIHKENPCYTIITH